MNFSKQRKSFDRNVIRPTNRVEETHMHYAEEKEKILLLV